MWSKLFLESKECTLQLAVFSLFLLFFPSRSVRFHPNMKQQENVNCMQKSESLAGFCSPTTMRALRNLLSLLPLPFFSGVPHEFGRAQPDDDIHRIGEQILGSTLYSELKAKLKAELAGGSTAIFSSVDSNMNDKTSTYPALSHRALSSDSSLCTTTHCIELTTGIASWRGATETEPAANWLVPSDGTWLGSRDVSTCVALQN